MWLVSIKKERRLTAQERRYQRRIQLSIVALVAGLGFGTAPAHAQPPATEPPKPAPATEPEVPPPPPPARFEAARVEEGRIEMVKGAPGVAPWLKGGFPTPARLEWHGSMETDVGFARYTFDTPSENPSSFYDFRGRFVLGPAFRYDFAGDWFFRTTG